MTKVDFQAKPNPQILLQQLQPTDWFFTHNGCFCMYLEAKNKKEISVLAYDDDICSLGFATFEYDTLVTPVKNITISIT